MSRAHTAGGIAAAVLTPLLVAADAQAASGPLQLIFGEDFEMSSMAMLVFLALVVPIGAFSVFLSWKILGGDDDNLGSQALMTAFFQRLGFGVAFWVIIMTHAYRGFPLGESALLFLTNLGVAVLAMRFARPDGLARVVIASAIFCVVDGFALSGAFLGSAALF